MFSDLSLCFLTCYFVFEFVIVFSDYIYIIDNVYLLFYNVFFIVVVFSDYFFFFLICICICNLLFCFQNRDLFCTSQPP